MREAERHRLEQLIDWKPDHGVISAYFDVDPGDRRGAWRIVLKDGLTALEEPEAHEGKIALRETVQRMLESHSPEAGPPDGRTQIDLAEVARDGAREDSWSTQLEIGDAAVARAPRPILRPLIDLLI